MNVATQNKNEQVSKNTHAEVRAVIVEGGVVYLPVVSVSAQGRGLLKEVRRVL